MEAPIPGASIGLVEGSWAMVEVMVRSMLGMRCSAVFVECRNRLRQ